MFRREGPNKPELVYDNVHTYSLMKNTDCLSNLLLATKSLHCSFAFTFSQNFKLGTK